MKVAAMDVAGAFSTNYQEARAKFLQTAAAAGLALSSHAHPLKGVDGEDLAMDLAFEGNANSDCLLILSSACHGVEGYCGSGVQVFGLADPHWHEKVAASGIAVLYVHALNPHGFSFKRRVTHENVDLNRNFHDFTNPLPQNPAYASVHDIALPAQWPPTPENQAEVSNFIAKHGMPALQAALSGGQHSHADGVFFGGTAPTWSNTTIRQVLRDFGKNKRQLGWIDFHTGLGPSGHGERIHMDKEDDPASIDRARAWWGGGKDGNAATPITSFQDGSSSSAKLTGTMAVCAKQELPNVQLTAIAMEYGTQPMLAVLNALRGDHWAHRERLQGRTVATDLQATITQATWDAFYTQTPEWKAQIISQGRQAMFQAVDGLVSA